MPAIRHQCKRPVICRLQTFPGRQLSTRVEWQPPLEPQRSVDRHHRSHPGPIQLFGTVDAQNYYLESNERNNMTWTILQLNGDNTVKVIQQGPHV